MANKTNIGLVQHALAWVGRPYWYGTCCYDCTTSLYKTKAAQYPAHYTSSRKSRYDSDIKKGEKCADCIGLLKGYMWLNEETGKRAYGTNGCPDKSANGMIAYAKAQGLDWGTIATLPEIPGLALWRDGHVGIYIGDGQIVEARGFNYGVVKTKVASRNFTHWFMLPGCEYVGYTAEGAPEAKECALGERMLRKGSTGSDVKTMQLMLASLNYATGEADGEFGPKTLAAVKSFQTDHDLEVDGIYGPLTHAALVDATQTPAQIEDESHEGLVPVAVATVTGETLNVRVGAGTQYAVEFVANKGDMLTIPDTTNWTPVLYNGKVCWVSNDYIQR